MKQLTILALAGAMSSLIVSAEATAAVVVTVSQVGSDVVATTTGTLSLSGLQAGLSSTAVNGVIPTSSYIFTGGSVNTRQFAGFGGIGAFGPSGFTARSSGTGVSFYLDGDLTQSFIGLPVSFVSGGSVAGTSTWSNTTLATLGLVAGTYVTQSSGDTITVVINATSAVPEPTAWAMLLVGFGAIGAALRRKTNVQARIRFA